MEPISFPGLSLTGVDDNKHLEDTGVDDNKHFRGYMDHKKLDNMNRRCSDNDAVAIELRIYDPKQAEKEDRGKWTTVREKLTAKTHKARNWWNTIFILSCAFAIFNDPIFCYITSIDNKNKCYSRDYKLLWNYIWCRTATDVFYLLDIFISKCGCCCCCCRGRRKSSCTSCTTNFLSILSRIFVCLPIAQIAASVTTLHYSAAAKILFVALLQYALRICYIYDWLKRRPIIDITRFERPAKFLLGFVPFILTSHLFGAFWYLLATRRQLQCWNAKNKEVPALQNVQMIFRCPGSQNDNRSINTSLWEEYCPVKVAQPETFDFGIYLYALQSEVANPSHRLTQRVLQSFWWALRNLSSFGSNLNSSMDKLEITFSVSISITGMALFLVYLNARVKESQEISKKRMLDEKKQLMKPDLDLWISKYHLSTATVTESIKKKKENLKAVILKNIQNLQENSDLDLQNVLGILPIKEKQDIMYVLFSDSWNTKVRVFPTIDDKVLVAICQHLLPLNYAEDSYIVQEGKPLGKMLLFIQGTAVTCFQGGTSSASSSSTKWLKKGDFHGDELLNWAFKSPSLSDLPTSTTSVVAHEKVEAFAIRAKDLKSICHKFWWLFSCREVNSSQLKQWECLARSSIKVALCRRLERKKRADSYVQPTKWFHRRARTKEPTHWNRFVVN